MRQFPRSPELQQQWRTPPWADGGGDASRDQLEPYRLRDGVGAGPHAGFRSINGLIRGERAVSDEDIPMTRAMALALKLSLVTAQRIGEVVGIAQSELDLNEAAPVWTMPRQRAKNGQPNRVPLSPVAVRLIKEAQEFGGGGAWLFPSPRSPAVLASRSSVSTMTPPTRMRTQSRPGCAAILERIPQRRVAALRLQMHKNT